MMRQTATYGQRVAIAAAALAALLLLTVTSAAQDANVMAPVGAQQTISAEQARSAFREANVLYADGRYAEAAALYEAILAGGFLNADVYYNLGNALYMEGDIAGAVLGYERALRLDGSHEDASANLEFVREQLADRQVRVGGTFSDVLDRFFRRASVARLAIIVSLLYFLAAGALILGVLRGVFTPWLMRCIVVVLALFLVAGSVLAFRVHRTSAVREAVITVADVPVRTGPGDDFVLEFRLHEGTKVRLRESRDDWARVSVEGTDLEGWLPERTLEEI
jgi:SH3-like domain-containing protein